MSPRRKSADPWPRPGDSTLDRSRSIAESYRTVLLRVDPDACAKLDARAIRLGQGWIVPQPAVTDENLDEPQTVDQIAAYCYVQTSTVDKWMGRGLRWKDTPDGRRITVRDLLDYQVGQRKRRAASRKVG